MTEEKKELNTIMSYGERLTTGFTLTVLGIFLLIASFIVLLIAQGIFIYRPESLSHSAYLITSIAAHLLSFLLMFLSMKMIFSLADVTKSLFPQTQKKLIFAHSLIVFITSLNLYLIAVAVIWLFIKPAVSLTLTIIVILLWIKMRKIKQERSIKIEEELAKTDEKTFGKVSEMIDDTYADVSDKINTVRNVIDKIKKL